MAPSKIMFLSNSSSNFYGLTVLAWVLLVAIVSLVVAKMARTRSGRVNSNTTLGATLSKRASTKEKGKRKRGNSSSDEYKEEPLLLKQISPSDPLERREWVARFLACLVVATIFPKVEKGIARAMDTQG